MMRRHAVRYCGLISAPMFFVLQGSPLPALQGGDAAGRTDVRSTVTYQDGVLYIQAANVALNDLVAEIARRTGMKISGQVVGDKVFGNYGPADPQKVLATLLSGTGSNLLIVSNPTNHLVELVLTPRQGTASPPSEQATVERQDTEEEAPASRPPNLDPARLRNQGQQPEPREGDRSARAEVQGTPPLPTNAEGETAGQSATGGDAGSNNTVKTPEQIFQQLQRLRQQQNGTGSPPSQ